MYRADCVSDHEILVAKFRATFKKVPMAAVPICYDYNADTTQYCITVQNKYAELLEQDAETLT